MGEVSVSTKGSDFALILSQGLFNELGLRPDGRYEIARVKQGLWTITEKEAAVEKENPLDRKIIATLLQKNLPDRVEGMFEGFLDKEQLLRFKEMVREGKIVPFKLSMKYRKAVYKTREEVEGGKASRKESESPNAKSKPIADYSLEKDGFLVCKNEERAKALSQQLKKDIEDGNIKGIKAFDGLFYIIEGKLYDKYRQQALQAVRESKSLGLQQLGEKIGTSELLAKIVSEFLKDEGEIIEKREGQFQAVE